MAIKLQSSGSAAYTCFIPWIDCCRARLFNETQLSAKSKWRRADEVMNELFHPDQRPLHPPYSAVFRLTLDIFCMGISKSSQILKKNLIPFYNLQDETLLKVNSLPNIFFLLLPSSSQDSFIWLLSFMIEKYLTHGE